MYLISSRAKRLMNVNISRAYCSKGPSLQKKAWKKDVVYLHQFPRSPIAPNLSPFCLKVETFIRAHDIKYESKSTWLTRSVEGRLPFIELNGKQIADSQVILWRLVDHFKINFGLDVQQEGTARAIDRLIEGSSYYAMLLFCSYENSLNLTNPQVSGLRLPSFFTSILAKRLAETARKRLATEGTLRHPRDLVVEMLRSDLDALTHLLGEKKFFLGMRPTIPDFTFFGHFGLVYHFPFDQPAKNMLEKEERYKSLRMLIKRMRSHYWPNWPEVRD